MNSSGLAKQSLNLSKETVVIVPMLLYFRKQAQPCMIWFPFSLKTAFWCMCIKSCLRVKYWLHFLTYITQLLLKLNFIFLSFFSLLLSNVITECSSAQYLRKLISQQKRRIVQNLVCDSRKKNLWCTLSCTNTQWYHSFHSCLYFRWVLKPILQ